MSPRETIEEALHAASRFVLDHFECPEGSWYDDDAQLLNKKLRDALAALNEVAASGVTEEERVQKVATVIAYAMFSDGEKSPTIAGYQRAARAAIRAMGGE